MNVHTWEQKGKLYLWRYESNPKNYSGWHITGDKEGINSFVSLLDNMLKDEQNSKRTLKLIKPTEKIHSVTGCSDKVIHEHKVILRYEVDEPVEWEIKPYADTMDIITNNYSTKNLRSGLLDIVKGKGDYSMEYENNKLWFWWLNA